MRLCETVTKTRTTTRRGTSSNRACELLCHVLLLSLPFYLNPYSVSGIPAGLLPQGREPTLRNPMFMSKVGAKLTAGRFSMSCCLSNRSPRICGMYVLSFRVSTKGDLHRELIKSSTQHAETVPPQQSQSQSYRTPSCRTPENKGNRQRESTKGIKSESRKNAKQVRPGISRSTTKRQENTRRRRGFP